jgi:hypothetical protein
VNTRFAIVVAALLFAACDPIYTTDYRYTPPTDKAGKQCLAQCGAARSFCRSAASQEAQNDRLQCDLAARDDYEHCLQSAHGDSSKCYRRSCTANPYYGTCESDYRECYQNCGGQVTEVKQCHFNCNGQ